MDVKKFLPKKDAKQVKQELPLHNFPKSIIDFVNEWYNVGKFPKSYTLLSVMTVCAAAIGKGAKICSPNGQETFCNIYAVIAGPNGARKSPPMEKALHPLEIIDSENLRNYNLQMGEYLRAKESEGKSEPVNKQVLFQDFSFEGLIKVLSQNGGAYMQFSDEIVSLFQKIFSDKDSFSIDSLLSFWNGKGYRKNRKGDSSVINIDSIVPCILGSTQLTEMNAIFNKRMVDNGLFARFLFAVETERVLTDYASYVMPNDVILNEYEGLIRRLFDISEPKTYYFEEKAIKEWQSFGQKINEMRARIDDDTVHGRDTKYEVYYLRFCLLLQVLKNVCSLAPADNKISSETANQAAELLFFYRNESDKVIELINGGYNPHAFSQKEKEVFNILPSGSFTYSEGMFKCGKTSDSTFSRYMRKFLENKVIQKDGIHYTKLMGKMR